MMAKQTRYPNLYRLLAYVGGLTIASGLALLAGGLAVKIGLGERVGCFFAGFGLMAGLWVLDEIMADDLP